MAGALTFTMDKKSLERKLQTLRDIPRAHKAKVFQLAGRQTVTFVKQTFATGGANAGISWPPASRGAGKTQGVKAGMPLLDTGTLMKSIVSTVSGDQVVIRAGPPGNVYAGVHQRGDTVRPIGNKFAWVPGGPYLNIPLQGAGVGVGDRRTFSLKAFPGWKARIEPGLGWTASIPDGTERYTDKRGRDRERTVWKPVAVLRKQTKIKARPFLFWSAPLVKEINRMVGVYIRERLHGKSETPAPGGGE